MNKGRIYLLIFGMLLMLVIGGALIYYFLIYQADAGETSISRVSDSRTGSADQTGRDDRLIYLWPANRPADLYILDPQSGAVDRLTNLAGVLDYCVNQDGTEIFFSARNNQGGSDIFKIDSADTTPLLAEEVKIDIVVDCGTSLCQAPALSADGQYLAYERITPVSEGNPTLSQIVLLSLESENSQVIGDQDHNLQGPAWSSQGTLLFYDLDQQSFMVYNQPSGSLVGLKNQTGEAGSWAPDGKSYVTPEIFYVGDPAQPFASSHLLLYNISDGSIARDLTVAEDLEDASPAVSPDGRTIVFARRHIDPARWTPGRQIWTMGIAGDRQTQVTDEPLYHHYDFMWSSDGDQIAYMRSNQASLDELPELWLSDIDGSNAVQLVIGGYAPKWIR